MSDSIASDRLSSYLHYLPAVFQQAAADADGDFLGRFLLAFEHILSGLGAAELRGLEEMIDDLDHTFNPQQTPEQFLPWLAGWLALTLRADWSVEEQRRFIAGIVPLYRQRGTKAGLIKLLHTYTNLHVAIEDYGQPFQIGVMATLGQETVLGGVPPHFFLVTMILGWKDAMDLSRKEQIVRAILAQEKPAHTQFALRLALPKTEIGIPGRADVGISTFVG